MPGRKIAVMGTGMVEFGVFPERGIRSMAEEVLYGALTDAGAVPSDVEVAYCGTMGFASDTPDMHGPISFAQVGITGVPILQMRNGCASGSNAFREAWVGLQSGLYEVAAVLGIEKLSAPSLEMLRLAARMGGGDGELEGSMGFFPPGIFAMIARHFMDDLGVTREQIAEVSVKNHYHASLNPYAHFPKEVTVEQVLASRPVATPLNMLDCCPIDDGAAAVVLASEEAVGRFSGEPVWVTGSAQTSGTYPDSGDVGDTDTTRRAAREAYEMAGVGPGDIDLAEVHDCFTVAELLHYRDLGFCGDIAEAAEWIRDRRTWLGGGLPVNTSGGLLAKGHPLGATGVAQVCEVAEQLRGRAGPRQVEGARLGLTHNGGGFRHGDVGSVCVHILQR